MIYKIFIFLLLTAVIGLMLTGVIEIKINTAKLASLPATLASFSKNKSALEQGRALLVNLKRKGEQMIITDKAKKLQLALIYVEKDAARLRELASKENNPAVLVPQADSLIKSIELVRNRSEEAPVQSVAELKTESATAFQDALLALGMLKDLHEDYKEIQQEFSRLTKALEQHLGDLELTADDKNEENVADAQTDEQKPAETPSASPEEEIPLKF